MQFFSVEVLCQAGAPDQIGLECPACHTPQSPVTLATELDQPEVSRPLDEEAIARAINRRLEPAEN